jgi:hypothetical protein
MSEDRFAALVTHVGAFHITDRSMRAAQHAAETAVRDGHADEAARRAYVAAVQHYFAGFEREARLHLRDVDKRLEGLNQMIFNLSAERGVAVKRIEATQAVLEEANALENSVR